MTETTTPTSSDTSSTDSTNAGEGATTTIAETVSTSPSAVTVAPPAVTAPPSGTANPYATPSQASHSTLTTPAAAAPGASNGFSVSSLILGIASIPTGLSLLAIAAIVLGFLGRSKEPQARTMALWGIWLGFIGLFGWIIIAVLGLVLAAPFALLGFGWGWGWWGF